MKYFAVHVFTTPVGIYMIARTNVFNRNNISLTMIREKYLGGRVIIFVFFIFFIVLRLHVPRKVK